jgi:hypothetical protein
MRWYEKDCLKSRVTKLQRVQAIAGGWRLLMQSSFLLLLLKPGLRVLGFNRIANWLGIAPGNLDLQFESQFQARAEDIAYLVQGVAARLPVRSTCLARSLVLWRLLKSEGIDAQLYIGVRGTQALNDVLNAHAWIEFNGHVLNDNEEVRTTFFPLATFVSRTIAQI